MLKPLEHGLAALERRARAAEQTLTATHQAREALLDSVDEATQAAGIDANDRAMIRSVVELGEQITREIMVPRTAMIVIDHHKTIRQAISLLLRSGHSRIPVIGEGIDDVIGLIYLKDATLATFRDPSAAERAVATVMRPAHWVPESKPADNLLRELQALGQHMAIVVDEFGGVAGLVTIEDVVEEIVGELVDEHDPDPPQIEPLGDGLFRLPATLPLDDLETVFGRMIDDQSVDTVGGLLTRALGRVPVPDAQAVVQGLSLTAERTEGRRKRLATVLARDVSTVDERPNNE
ncbi:MAG: hemolysin family protein [Bifidobacteriaceae bacterium]|nr:hemolysin family protein [Bifidobacteriaceae bacterium]